ncbi:sensor histidine kinase [Amycolatopsis sp.]|jgi:signal transduction histidine kinase|uniref:sensor histidine kinase n=1 Tax=Amycolatopsis sp. TaxID=37632 RepID=UPI002DFC74B1|nr:histidine kinase [Amycolatopsis sp.]
MSLLVRRFRALPLLGQDGLIALGTWLAGLVLYVSGMFPLVNMTEPVPFWARFLVLTGMCALRLVRRLAPTALIAATALLMVDFALGPTIPVLLVFADHLYVATLHGSRRIHRAMITIAALGTLTMVAVVLLLSTSWRAGLIAALAAMPFLIMPVWWATNVRQQRDIADNERENAVQLARIGELDRHAAVAAERARMARDLHDVIAGHLSAIAIQSEAVLTMSTADPATSHTVLRSVRENSVSALDEMRAMIGLLREGGSDEETTAPARLAQLSKLVESARASGMHVDVESEMDGSATLPAAVDLTAYRIAQEALTNAVKHAPGARTRVDIQRADGILTVEVTNELEAAGMKPRYAGQPGAGTGLLNMRERASAVGGSLSAGPSAGRWRVHAELPVPEH